MCKARKVVTNDVSAGDLPASVRGEFSPQDVVRVTLEAEESPSTKYRYKKFKGIAASRNTSIAEAVARVRALREEWD